MSLSERAAALRAPGEVIEIARTLRDAGFETWCVGGAVRDALLGLNSLDWDLATAASPHVVRRMFRRTIPVGIEFGTVGVLDRAGVMHEVTTFRRDVHTDGRHAVVEFGVSLDDDLARRDFTINAIAFDPIARRIHDPFGGQQDLVDRKVRAVGRPDARFEEDRLRALRAIRFAARFEFEIEPLTWRAVIGSAPFMSRLSPERVKQELEKTMEQVERPSTALARWRDSGAFASLVPALAAIGDEVLAAVDQVRQPTLRTRPMRRTLRMAALMSELDGPSAERSLRALRFSNHDTAWIGALVASWHALGTRLTAGFRNPQPPSNGELRRLAAELGRLRVGPFLRLAAARWSAMAPGHAPDAAQIRSVYRRAVRIAFRDAIAVADLAIDGEDLRQAGLAPGPLYRQLLVALLEEVVRDPSCNERSHLVARATELAPLLATQH